MKTTLTALCILLASLAVNAQQKDDRHIIITFVDSTIAKAAIKRALIENDYQIKELDKKDTLLTYPREMKKMAGYAVVNAFVNDNSVILSGYYGSKKLNYFGADLQPKDYIQIRYYSSSKSWRELMVVAESTGGTISYGK